MSQGYNELHDWIRTVCENEYNGADTKDDQIRFLRDLCMVVGTFAEYWVEEPEQEVNE